MLCLGMCIHSNKAKPNGTNSSSSWENTATAHVMSPVREHMLPKMKTTTGECRSASQNDTFQQADYLRHNQSRHFQLRQKKNL